MVDYNLDLKVLVKDKYINWYIYFLRNPKKLLIKPQIINIYKSNYFENLIIMSYRLCLDKIIKGIMFNGGF